MSCWVSYHTHFLHLSGDHFLQVQCMMLLIIRFTHVTFTWSTWSTWNTWNMSWRHSLYAVLLHWPFPSNWPSSASIAYKCIGGASGTPITCSWVHKCTGPISGIQGTSSCVYKCTVVHQAPTSDCANVTPVLCSRLVKWKRTHNCINEKLKKYFHPIAYLIGHNGTITVCFFPPRPSAL